MIRLIFSDMDGTLLDEKWVEKLELVSNLYDRIKVIAFYGKMKLENSIRRRT